MRPSAAADDGVTRAPSDTTAPAGAGGAETMMPTVSADGGRPAAPSDTTAPAADGATPTASPTAAIPAASQMATATSSGGAPVGPIVGGVLGVLVLGGIVMAVAIKTGCFKSCSYGTAPNATIPVGGAAAAPQTSSVQPVGSSGDSATQYPVAHQYPVAYPYPEARESLPASERSAIE
ncbi:unnamed protein product [Ectocarpus sp. 6 AP-2014]|uniref:Uncharacterized protein n=1 Tax=Ectocarpus siliculosus TaxID=2880 RepID=D8LPL8_ECTSI|nr:expressed unknown protein [Ectocarpus siliculosus]|eukprot:CBN80490.1 expressed unknown protein [Ectocarpus siliculosus]